MLCRRVHALVVRRRRIRDSGGGDKRETGLRSQIGPSRRSRMTIRKKVDFAISSSPSYVRCSTLQKSRKSHTQCLASLTASGQNELGPTGQIRPRDNETA
jgi:hypothetical protein